MRCSKCGTDNREGRKFCAKCAAPLARLCAQCGVSNEPGEDFCGECAAPLGKSPAASATESNKASIRIADTPENLEGERKTITALFADIKGSMELIEDLDPEEARAIVDPALKLMMEAVQRYGGYVAQSTGDGIFALFGAPVAHEDHPQRALYAALRMQEELKRYSDRIRSEGRLPIQARVGVNTGEVVVRSIATGEGRSEYAPVGHSTGIAARMQALAPVGSIAATGATRELGEGYFTFKALGRAVVKGVSGPLDVYEVTGLGPLRTRLQRMAGRGLTKFVGRQREMDAIKHASEQAKAGHGRIVAVIADAGVGKSRLLFEFRNSSLGGWLVLDALPLSHDKQEACLPLINLLNEYFGIAPDDNAGTRREKVATKLAMLDMDRETLAHLCTLLGVVDGADPFAEMDAPVRRRRTQEAVKRILLRESLSRPLMLIFEDLHWIDEETQAFLNVLVEGIANSPVLLLLNYRPQYTHQWGSKTYYTQLRLDPLGKESAEEMLSTLLGDEEQLSQLKHLIIEKTEGNPLFIEEIFQALLDDGSIKRNGKVKLVRQVEDLKLPPTVQGILASRIDRLPVDEKDLLQTLAVIGKNVPLTLASAVIEKPDNDLERMLNDLQLAEFIYERPALGGIEYTFKHALSREVAYNSILVARRRYLHERVAGSIEEIFADRLEDMLSQLASHHNRAGNTAKGVFYLERAAQRAMRGSTYGEAVTLLKSGLELIKTLPEDNARDRLEKSLCLDLYQAAKVVQVRGLASEELLNRTRRLCEKVNDDAGLFKVLEHLANHHGNRLDASGTRSVRDDLLKVANRIRDPSLLAQVRLGLGRAFLLEGHFQNAAEQFDRMPKLGESDLAAAERSIVELNSHCYGMSAWSVWFLGYPRAALLESDESVAISTALGSPVVSARALAGRSALHLFLRDPESALQSAEAAIKICNQEGLSWALQLSGLYRSWALIQRGEASSAIVALLGGRTPTRGIAAQIRNRAARDGVWGGTGLTRFFTCLAEGCLRGGYIEPGLEVVDESLSVAHMSGVSLYEAETFRLKGDLVLAKGTRSNGQAEESYRQAIAVARGQAAKSWELRATTSLARLLASQGRRDQARAMLADIYNWFTEGFDTADLKDAKALLEELANPPEVDGR